MGKSLANGITFVADSAILRPAVKRSLKKAATDARGANVRLGITGFANNTSRGSKYEKSVAERRALAVSRYLRKQGVSGWIFYQGLSGVKGQDFPGQIRRVEVRILD
jgi:outer membrane protein OmpA-like peptidoglycan-associated protein